MADVKRATRVGERVHEEISRLLSREVSDPGVEGVLVSRVEMTDDLGLCRVYFRLLEGTDQGRIKSATKGLERASGLLRTKLTKALGLRTAPMLKFFYDEGLDHRTRVEQLLNEIATEKKGS